jgi:hypothetical protein
MKTSTWVEIWDTRRDYDKFATIGINWSAVGPVTPRRARKFASLILLAATKAEIRIKKLKDKGYVVKSSERS